MNNINYHGRILYELKHCDFRSLVVQQMSLLQLEWNLVRWRTHHCLRYRSSLVPLEGSLLLASDYQTPPLQINQRNNKPLCECKLLSRHHLIHLVEFYFHAAVALAALHSLNVTGMSEVLSS